MPEQIRYTDRQSGFILGGMSASIQMDLQEILQELPAIDQPLPEALIVTARPKGRWMTPADLVLEHQEDVDLGNTVGDLPRGTHGVLTKYGFLFVSSGKTWTDEFDVRRTLVCMFDIGADKGVWTFLPDDLAAQRTRNLHVNLITACGGLGLYQVQIDGHREYAVFEGAPPPLVSQWPKPLLATVEEAQAAYEKACKAWGANKYA